MNQIVLPPSPALQPPTLFAPTPKAAQRVVEFFTAQFNNDHTRKAYLNATRRFAAWCDTRGLHDLPALQPFPVASFVKGATGYVHATQGEAAPGSTAHAVGLAGDRSRHRCQSSACGARPLLESVGRRPLLTCDPLPAVSFSVSP
jgi:hypothetical protein